MCSPSKITMGTIGATFFVIGIGFLYMATGTLNIADLPRLLSDSTPRRSRARARAPAR